MGYGAWYRGYCGELSGLTKSVALPKLWSELLRENLVAL